MPLLRGDILTKRLIHKTVWLIVCSLFDKYITCLQSFCSIEELQEKDIFGTYLLFFPHEINKPAHSIIL